MVLLAIYGGEATRTGSVNLFLLRWSNANLEYRREAQQRYYKLTQFGVTNVSIIKHAHPPGAQKVVGSQPARACRKLNGLLQTYHPSPCRMSYLALVQHVDIHTGAMSMHASNEDLGRVQSCLVINEPVKRVENLTIYLEIAEYDSTYSFCRFSRNSTSGSYLETASKSCVHATHYHAVSVSSATLEFHAKDVR